MSLQEYKMPSLKDKHVAEAQTVKENKEKVEAKVEKVKEVKVKGRRLNK